MNHVKNSVLDIVKKHKTNDPYELATRMNIEVVPWNLHEEIYGFYKYEKKNRFIFINSNLNEELKKFICAHELGHATLHTKISTPFLKNSTFFSVDKIEVEANTFAVELLLPDDHLNTYRNSDLTIYHAATACGIPKEFIRLKQYKNF